MTGAFGYTNRRGEKYLLGVTVRQGRPKYSFARKLAGEPAPAIPQGYEPREHPETGKVTLRKIVPSLITLEEQRLLEDQIRRQTKDLLFIVDRERRALVVYTSGLEADAHVNALRQIFPMAAAAAAAVRKYMLGNARYQKMMRFTLLDKDQRLFSLDRWCFKGSIEDWLYIDGDMPLPELASKYVRHLDKESFFELM